MLHVSLLKLLGYKTPMSCAVMYLCHRGEATIRVKNKYLIKALSAAAKKLFERNGEGKDQWSHLGEEMYTMEKITHSLKLRKAHLDERWVSWTVYMTNSDKIQDLIKLKKKRTVVG